MGKVGWAMSEVGVESETAQCHELKQHRGGALLGSFEGSVGDAGVVCAEDDG